MTEESPEHSIATSEVKVQAGSTNGFAFVLGLVALATAGVVLSLLPLLVNWVRKGDPTYLADGDQLLYMAWSRDAALRGAWNLCDAVNRPSGSVMHPWALFVPIAWISHALGADPRGLTVVWRIPAGIGVALGLLAAVRPAVRDRRVALGVAALLLFDAGTMFGQPGLRQLDVLYSALANPSRYFAGTPRAMSHLRVVPPALALPFLLAMQGLVVHSRATGCRRAAVGAGLLLGLLFHLYFYFWTTAVGGLAVALVLDRKAWRTYALVIGIGLVIGFPAVVLNARLKAANPPDWLNRTEKFVPIGHFQELLIPKVVIGLWLASGVPVFLRRRELALLWCTVGTGLACANHQVVSGLQIENFHWLVPAGTLFSVLLAALAAPLVFEPASGRPRLRLLAALLAAQVGVGLYLRVAETVRPPETERFLHVHDEFRADGLAVPPGAVLAGTPDAVLLSAALGDAYPLAGKLVEYCAPVTDAEFDERLLLNMYLLGISRDDARLEVKKPPGTLSWESLAVHSEPVAREQERRRLALIDRVWSDPAPVAARYGLTHLLIPADDPVPEAALAAVGRARVVWKGRYWQLWAVEPHTKPIATSLPIPSGRAGE